MARPCGQFFCYYRKSPRNGCQMTDHQGIRGRPRKRGMTLVETLIASSVMLMLFGAVLAIFTVASRVQSSVQNATDLQQRALVSLEAMAVDLANARVVNPLNGNVSSSLTVQFPSCVTVEGLQYVALDASRAIQFDSAHAVTYVRNGTVLMRSWYDGMPRSRVIADLGRNGDFRIYLHDLHYARISITSSALDGGGNPAPAPTPAPFVAQSTVYLMNQ